MAQGFSYRAELDGLRAIAVASVIVYHLNEEWLPGGYLGVDLFFVLSGYLITSLLLVERSNDGRIDLLGFYARRARRLLPAMIVMLVATAAYFGMAVSALERTGLERDLIAALLYVANWNFIAEGDSYFTQYVTVEPVRHTWSLAIEEQFYLVWPLVFAAVGRTAKQVGAVALAGAAASAAALWFSFDPLDPSPAYFSSFTRVHELLIGVLLAAVMRVSESTVRRWTTPMFLPAVALLAVSIVTLGDESALFYRGGSFAVSLAAAIIIAALPAWPSATRALSGRRIVSVGLVSYGLYLWHWPIIVAVHQRWGPTEGPVQALGIILAAAAVSIVSYLVVERPIRTRSAFSASPRTTVAAVPIASVLTVLAIVLVVPTEKQPEWATNVQPSILEQDDADEGDTPAAAGAPVGDNATQRVAVVGDSVAVSLLPGFRSAAETKAIELLEAAIPACPVGYAPLFDNEGLISPYAEQCAEVRTAHDAALAAEPDLIVWHDLQSVLARRDDTGTLLLPGSSDWSAALVHSWRTILDRFLETGAEVVVLRPPLRSQDLLGCDSSIRRSRCLTIQTQDELIRHATDAFAHSISGTERVRILDLDPFVCPNGYPCPPEVDGLQLRLPDNDQTHFTEAGANWLVPQLLASL